MTNAVMAAAPGLWGPGAKPGPDAAQAAEPIVHAARAGAADALDLAAASPALVIALGVGLALWLVGDRLFRPAASLVGAVVGALLGLAVSASWQGGQVAGVPAPYAAIGLGSLLGLAIGAAMYRLAVGGAAAITLAGLAGALAAAVALHEPPTGPPADRPDTTAQAAGAESPRIEHAGFGDDLSLDQLRAAADDAGSRLRAEWEAIPGHVRTLVTAASILGCVVGFAAGVIKPRTAGPAVAALAGAGLWIGATTALLIQAGRQPPPMPTERPGAWLVAWMLVALIGFAAQRRVFRPAALVANRSDAD
ncbi:MAG TPA: hypothetical protein VFF69_02995 [Phycisphaerales bacterium]|nr:hypothetical protein [Phycisphaerales bacterium]